MRSFLISLTRDPISLTGSAITTASVVLIATLFILEQIGLPGSPYVGILTYLILPGLLLVGLILIPIGIRRERKRASRTVGDPPSFPVIDLNSDKTRRSVMIFLLLTLVNIVILAAATYKGVEVMESREFCGTTCHVMEPENTAYEYSPHTRVACVKCHIGPGAGWFVKSKLSGAWQVVSVAFDLYPRPIPTPVHNLRPARETCEQCHWPEKFVGDRLEVITHYGNDEDNTESKSVLLLRIGGIEGRNSHGIHWHVDPNNEIRYLSDESRERITVVELTTQDGTVKRYASPDSDETETEEMTWRTMDCVDCHNRPTHVYQMPGRAIDNAIQQEHIDRSLPYIRREGLTALKREYTSHEEARQKIDESIRGFYREKYPDLDPTDDRIEQAVQALGDAYNRNVFPAMAVTWGTYPDHIGHENFEGCFRCHNDEHATEDGDVISQDCDTCHTLLAMEEEDPEILEMLQP